ncbi:PqiC family protein [Acidocella facilis]|uniref:PqiC family protein n=1 Tax=Acidocella facilis TaxID=525 RepID=UPI00047D07EE|nr:PqiC family protein [Acidocella facilis]
MRRTVLLLLLLLSACAGKPTTYLALAPVPGVARPAHGLKALAVSAIDIPPAIDRLHLTTGAAPGVLHVAGNTQWAGPLGPMAQIVLAQDLAARLTRTDVLMPGDPLPPEGAASLQVTVQDFMPDAKGQVRLRADWTALAPDGQRVLAQGRFSQRFDGGQGRADEARSMSRALGALADQIAARLAGRV